MKLINHLFFLTLVFVLTSGCRNSQQNTSTLEDAPVKEWVKTDIRDVPGLSFKRGLISNTDDATPGYILFHPTFGTSTYLANLDGQIVYEMKAELSSMLSYLMDDGRIIRHERDIDFPTFAAGGQSGRIREYTWDGKMTWDYEYATDKLLTHHDLAILPNGNVLAIAWEVKTKEECIALGVNPENLPEAGLWFDKIIEIEPKRPGGGDIVWEWRMWDHLIQDFDPSKPNFGVPGDNPRRINLTPHMHPIHMTQEQVDGAKKAGFMTSNATVENQGSDLTHLNAIDYNADLDQIAISSFNFSEIYIIDHSTTTEEAMGSTGGRFGHGGDLLYRWGNPQNYNQGGPEDQQLFHQHDVRWIPKGYPGEGNLTIFNNDIYGGEGEYPNVFAALSVLQKPNLSIAEVDNYSAVFEIKPPIDQKGNYSISTGEPFGPAQPLWSYTAPDKYSFMAPFVSNAHRLKSGNTFINEGPRGRFFEVNPEGRKVWEYLNPYNGGYVMPDGSLPQPAGPFMFAQYRVEHIPADHPALAGKPLKPISPQPKVFAPPPPPQNGH